MKELEGYAVNAIDGDIGRVEDILLDDEFWVVRYLIVETQGLVDGRQVLISPISFREVESSLKRFHLNLTKTRVNGSPNIKTNLPVSRQHERDYFHYYGYAPYWGYGALWGLDAYPGALANETLQVTPPEPSDVPDDAHLRSASEVRGYHVQGVDDTIGHVEDFIVDDETWAVRYLVIDTSNWWFGKKVLVEPRWASRVSWEDRKVYVDLSREAIKNSPEWNASLAIDRAYETRLHQHYGRPLYWDSVTRPSAAPLIHAKKTQPPLREG